MKREQIIHALYTQKVIGNIDLMELLEKAGYKDYSISAIIDRITDAILALPLDVPSEEEINNIAYDYCMFEGGDEGEPEADPEAYRHFRDGMISMKNEIIRRNK